VLGGVRPRRGKNRTLLLLKTAFGILQPWSSYEGEGREREEEGGERGRGKGEHRYREDSLRLRRPHDFVPNEITLREPPHPPAHESGQSV
jgi:hypothetical protein